MPHIIIKHRITGNVLYDGDAAYLRGCNLRDANLSDANLSGCNLRGCNLRDAKNSPLIINGLRWQCLISGTGWMKIGCQKHSIAEWSSFDDDRIASMSPDALVFWSKHKNMLLSICNTYKHEGE